MVYFFLKYHLVQNYSGGAQIEDAYKSGAEWCNYGWSDNQLALFPTQKTTWHKLQKIKGHKHDCGRAGINGGFIANPNDSLYSFGYFSQKDIKMLPRRQCL